VAVTLPEPIIVVGGEDITALVDLTTLRRYLSERGEASASFDIELDSENECPTNVLARDAAVCIYIEGDVRWLGHVVSVSQPQPRDPVITVECAGQWDVLHQREDYAAGFVETRLDAVAQLPDEAMAAWGLSPCGTAVLETEGCINLIFPKGQAAKYAQGVGAYLPLFNLAPTASKIRRVTATVTTSGLPASVIASIFLAPSPYTAVGNEVAMTRSNGTLTAPIDYTFVGGSAPLALVAFLYVSSVSDMPAQAADAFMQIKNLRLYVDRTAAVTIDQAAAWIWTNVTGDSGTTTQGVGSTTTNLMVDPYTNAADAIQQVLACAVTPPLCGVLHGKFYCQPRPISSYDPAALWVVSAENTPGLQWDVASDMAQSVDFIALAYSKLVDNPTSTPSGLPAICYYPSTPVNKTDRVKLIQAGSDMYPAEAQAAAQQAYAYYHNLVQGSVVIPYVVRNSLGREVPVDSVECWDFIMNVGKLDPSQVGPFFISEVQLDRDEFGTIATLTIGSTDGYAFADPERLPISGNYVPGRRRRVRYKKKVAFSTYWHATHKKHHYRLKNGKWSKDMVYAPMPKHHPKYGYVWAYKTVESEGYYT
jgi:hypothetical protein